MVRPVWKCIQLHRQRFKRNPLTAATDKSEPKDPSTASQEPEVGSFAKTPQPLREKADLEVESKKRSEDLDKELRKYGDKTGKKSQEVKIEEPPDRTFKDVDGLKVSGNKAG